MNHFSAQGSMTICAIFLFLADSYGRWQRRRIGPVSFNTVLFPAVVLVALTTISVIAAVACPLTFADVLNQF